MAVCRWLSLIVLFAATPAQAAQRGSLSFGGFDADEVRYLARAGSAGLACAPLVAGAGGAVAGDPTCEAIDKKAISGFSKPERTHKLPDGRTLAVAISDGRLRLAAVDAGGAEQVLAAWAPSILLTSVNSNLFVSASGGLVAVEYGGTSKGGSFSDVVVFDLRGTRPASQPGLANAYDRATGKGGVWEQRIQPCEQAGVSLNLKKNRKFDIKIETRCQGDKNLTKLAGSWMSQGDDEVVLSFENPGGPTEAMPCRLAACSDVAEDCLTCTQDDVSFTLKVVRR